VLGARKCDEPTYVPSNLLPPSSLIPSLPAFLFSSFKEISGDEDMPPHVPSSPLQNLAFLPSGMENEEEGPNVVTTLLTPPPFGPPANVGERHREERREGEVHRADIGQERATGRRGEGQVRQRARLDRGHVRAGRRGGRDRGGRGDGEEVVGPGKVESWPRWRGLLALAVVVMFVEAIILMQVANYNQSFWEGGPVMEVEEFRCDGRGDRDERREGGGFLSSVRHWMKDHTEAQALWQRYRAVGAWRGRKDDQEGGREGGRDRGREAGMKGEENGVSR